MRLGPFILILLIFLLKFQLGLGLLLCGTVFVFGILTQEVFLEHVHDEMMASKWEYEDGKHHEEDFVDTTEVADQVIQAVRLPLQILHVLSEYIVDSD